MKAIKLQGNHAGYAVWDPEKTIPELRHVGEEWAFPDYRVPEHSHPHYEFHLQLSGQTEWQVKTKSCLVQSNSLIAISPKVRSRNEGGRYARASFHLLPSLDVVRYCKN